MVLSNDLYKVLGLEKTATNDEIKRAYRILSLKYHPDKNKTKDATIIFQSINDAYSILYDENKRREYDSTYYKMNDDDNLFNNIPNTIHTHPVIPSPIPTHPHFNNSNQFTPTINSNNAIFRRNITPPERNIHIINYAPPTHGNISDFINPNVFQSYHYSNRLYQQQQLQENEILHSQEQNEQNHLINNYYNSVNKLPLQSVSFKLEEDKKCKSLILNIAKEVEISMEQSYNGCDFPIEIIRWVYKENVKMEEKETIYLSIHKGVDQNEVIEVKCKGNILNEKMKGDVFITVKIKNDTIFTRNGLDLYMNHKVTLKEALCGFSFEMKFINNKIFKINNGIGNIVSPGFKKIIKNMGMIRGETKGNLIIEFTVIFPTQLTIDKIEALGKIFT